MNHRGNRTYRFEQNPLEKVFSDEWEKENVRPYNGPGILELGMGDGRQAGIINQRDATVAASVVQWFGSPVGQHFLVKVLATTEAKEFRDTLEYELNRTK